MRAGAMKYRLSLLKPETVTDEFGATDTKYVQTVICHAERVSANAFRTDENGEHFADARVQFNIRDVHQIVTGMRCQHLGGELYSIVQTVRNIDRGFQTLICEKVNE